MPTLMALRMSMIGTLTFIIFVSTLFFAGLLTVVGSFDLVTVVLMVTVFNLAQWLIAPYLINGLYGVREVSETEEPRIHQMVRNLSSKLGMRPPRIGIASIPIPNAFAYGSPIAGSRVAITKGLLETLEEEEVEAVIGHELGHLKHRDVQIMMFASVLPAIFYYLGYSLMWSGVPRAGRRNGAGAAVLVGIASIAIYWILSLFVLYLSRLREYYADRRSSMIVEDGARKLSEGLAKIVGYTTRMRARSVNLGGSAAFKALFISDPDSAERDEVELARALPRLGDRELVEQVLSKKVSFADHVLEILSTHPNIVKRLRALQDEA